MLKNVYKKYKNYVKQEKRSKKMCSKDLKMSNYN